jgi:hypothetical protein
MVISATPIDLTRIIKVNKPMQRVRYELQEIGKPSLEDIAVRRKVCPQVNYFISFGGAGVCSEAPGPNHDSKCGGREEVMFVDEVEIYVRSGKGGDGMVHFHREKYVTAAGQMAETAGAAAM